MAVVIASDLSKDMVGEPLWKGVSFKLERRDRLTIAGRNGAGKTTLLRMLAGETSVDGGELVFAKGTRIALHDQRPPRERGITLRDYVLSGNPEPLELETRLRELEAKMAEGDETVYDAYARVTAEYDAVGGYSWREQANSVIHGLGRQVTTIVVAHRLSTVREADTIVLLEQGRVSATGTFDQLRSSNATFADLVRLGDLT